MLSTAIGCVGPSTPFGAVTSLKVPPQEIKEANEKKVMVEAPELREPTSIPILAPRKNPSISFTPDRQVLHTNRDWRIDFTDVDTRNFAQKVRIFFNRQDVTKRVLSLAKIEPKADEVTLIFPKLRLPFDRYNQIEVQYLNSDAGLVRKRFLPPACSMYDQGRIQNTEPFEVNTKLLEKIQKNASKYSLNPRMMAGIIGQESGFNPNAVSWAKAIGLTQVTPLAEAEILDEFDHFPRFPRLNSQPVWKIKSMIQLGKVNGKNEWRLNPNQSIEGGLAYLEYVDAYWRKEVNAQVLSTLTGDPYMIYTQVVLASYNSGPSRVKRAIQLMKDRWIQHGDLREAYKYVNRIFSYCHHFGTLAKETNDDPST